MADYIVNLNKKDSSITLQKVENNITLVKQEKQIILEHVGRKGEKGDQGIQGEQGAKGDKGEPGTPGTTVHSELTNLSYADSGHTGFQPAGDYLISETDPVFTAWDKDYNDLTNKPTIPDELSDLADDATHRIVTDTEKSYWNAKQEALTADVDYLTPGTASTTYEPLLPATPTDPDVKYLNGNRQWAPIAIGGGGFAANLYYTTIPSDVPGYYKLSYTAQTAETILSGVVNNNEVLFRTYLFDDPIDTSVIDGGVWGSVPWLYVSNAAGITRVKIELFVRHTGGTETTLFSGYTEEINSLVRTRFKSEITQSAFTVDPTDRLGARVYGTTTSNANITIYSVIGDGNASYFTTPLRIRHNQLRDLNGDPEYQHMTSAEKTILDSVPTTYLPLAGGTMTGKQIFDSTSNGLELYNTADQSTNYERVRHYWSSNIYYIDSQFGGSGTPRAVSIYARGPSNSYSSITLNRSTTPFFSYTHSASGAANTTAALFNGNTVATSGIYVNQSISPIVNQSSTAGYTALLINPTETATGSGAKNLIDAQVGGVSRFKVNNTGVVFPRQAETASAPAYVKGGIYFDTTINKLRVGGATGWETITSA